MAQIRSAGLPTSAGRRRWALICFVTFLLGAIRIAGQFDANPSSLTLGSRRFGSNNRYTNAGSLMRAEPLKVGTPIADGVKSPNFVGRVGGVAFDQVAMPANGFDIRDIKVEYRKSVPDGERLLFTINGRPHVARNLPDWFVVPIAKYADSPYYAVVTLFGELVGNQPKPDGYEYVVAYHPAFESTHLGLRLFQADFMLLDPEITGELPQLGGRYLLRKPEVEPLPAIWRPAAFRLHEKFVGHQFQSYVICDKDVDVRFRLANGQLELTGAPRFYFWQLDAAKQNVLEVRGLSDDISGSTDLLLSANPAVYQCLTLTMRYAALLRYCMRSDAEKPEAEQTWSSFMDAINAVPHTNFSAPTPVLVPKR